MIFQTVSTCRLCWACLLRLGSSYRRWHRGPNRPRSCQICPAADASLRSRSHLSTSVCRVWASQDSPMVLVDGRPLLPTRQAFWKQPCSVEGFSTKRMANKVSIILIHERNQVLLFFRVKGVFHYSGKVIKRCFYTTDKGTDTS